ncbi:MAG: hypothetical protein R6U26_02105 [Candidatus Undinarchaeales archaeon]
MSEEIGKKSKNKSNFFDKVKDNIWKSATIILFVILVMGLASINPSGFITMGGNNVNSVAESSVDYINSNLIQGDAEAELVSAVEENGLIQLTISLQGQEMDLFVTEDGEKMFTQAIDMTESPTQAGASAEAEQTSIPKTEKPVIDLYVMSFCPYGNQAEDNLYPVYNLLKDKVDFNVHYIVSVSGEEVRSLQGQPEVDQNIREICVANEYGEDKFWDFVTFVNENCGSNGNCWESALEEIGGDVEVIQNCVDSEGLELMKLEAQKAEEAEATGSPTMLINGVRYSGSRTPEAYKTAVCSAFTESPEECETALESNSETASGSC